MQGEPLNLYSRVPIIVLYVQWRQLGTGMIKVPPGYQGKAGILVHSGLQHADSFVISGLRHDWVRIKSWWFCTIEAPATLVEELIEVEAEQVHDLAVIVVVVLFFHVFVEGTALVVEVIPTTD